VPVLIALNALSEQHASIVRTDCGTGNDINVRAQPGPRGRYVNRSYIRRAKARLIYLRRCWQLLARYCQSRHGARGGLEQPLAPALGPG
jgi:hypothetical protein